MKKAFLLLFIIFSVQIVSAQKNPAKLVGTYQWCPFHCATIKLNDDFTFEYLLDGDLYNDERTKGVWTFISENKIHLKSPDRKLISKVSEERSEKSNEKILIKVLDTAEGRFQGIVIKANYSGIERQFITDENGICEIPRTNIVEITYTRFSEKYQIQKAETNQITFVLPATNEPYLDDFYLFKNNQLFYIDDKNKILGNGYKKLSKKASNKLFP